MKTNIGNADRIARVIVGLGLISIAFVGPKTPWGFVGIVPLITAGIGFCPLYTFLGINTCPAKK